MTLLDDMREVMTAALGHNGYKQDNDSKEAMDKAKKLYLNGRKILLNLILNHFGKGFAKIS